MMRTLGVQEGWFRLLIFSGRCSSTWPLASMEAPRVAKNTRQSFIPGPLSPTSILILGGVYFRPKDAGGLTKKRTNQAGRPDWCSQMPDQGQVLTLTRLTASSTKAWVCTHMGVVPKWLQDGPLYSSSDDNTGPFDSSFSQQ